MRSLGTVLYKLYKKLPVIAFDVLVIPLAWFGAYWLRYNMTPIPHSMFNKSSLYSLLILIGVQLSCYYYFKVYRGLWMFTSMNDMVRIIKSVSVGILLTVPILYLSSLLMHIPRAVLPLYSILMIGLHSSGRLIMRIYRDKGTHSLKKELAHKQRVLIMGAGLAGEGLVRDLKRSKLYFPVGLLDDNPSKRGLEIHGIRVLGATRELPEMALLHRAEMIFIAIPSARSTVMRRLVDLCEKTAIPFRTLPGLKDLASGFVQINVLREVNLEDLLGRDEVQLEWDRIAGSIQHKTVAVTGAGGSIGSELCRQIMQQNPAKMLLIDNCEFNLYEIEQELTQSYPQIEIIPLLVSVTDEVAINHHFHAYLPKILFHAAAFKHVPMLEHQIRAAVQNNVLGTQIVAEAAVAIHVEKFILVSTDKAVNPANVMGTTKRVAEIYCQNLNERVDTQFITVRFGNVLGSAGSVVPLFQKQLKAGEPLTVTHPDIERYFMTIPEASQLILQAMVSGQGNEIFVLDMGEPIKISYLAEQMIRLAGKIPGKDVEIHYTGLRPGEKLFEELFHESEKLVKTDHEKLLKASFRNMDWNELMQTFRLLQLACDKHNNEELYILIKSLVPEFATTMENNMPNYVSV